MSFSRCAVGRYCGSIYIPASVGEEPFQLKVADCGKSCFSGFSSPICEWIRGHHGDQVLNVRVPNSSYLAENKYGNCPRSDPRESTEDPAEWKQDSRSRDRPKFVGSLHVGNATGLAGVWFLSSAPTATPTLSRRHLVCHLV